MVWGPHPHRPLPEEASHLHCPHRQIGVYGDDPPSLASLLQGALRMVCERGARKRSRSTWIKQPRQPR